MPRRSVHSPDACQGAQATEDVCDAPAKFVSRFDLVCLDDGIKWVSAQTTASCFGLLHLRSILIHMSLRIYLHIPHQG